MGNVPRCMHLASGPGPVTSGKGTQVQGTQVHRRVGVEQGQPETPAEGPGQCQEVGGWRGVSSRWIGSGGGQGC